MADKRAVAFNGLVVWVGASAVVLVVLGWMLYSMADRRTSDSSEPTDQLMVYCAAGIRPAIEPIARQYEEEYGITIRLQYAGSETLLEQLDISKTGDLYVAADDSYVKAAQERDLVQEDIPLAKMRPVIMVRKGNPLKIQGIDDLLRDDVRTALGNPDQAAIGRRTRKILQASGHWERLEQHVTDTGTFLPTVPEVANAVMVGHVDAAIVWDATVIQYPELIALRTPELDQGMGAIVIGVLNSTESPTAALKFARYAAARDKGQRIFKEQGFEVDQGDTWAEQPELTFFAGSVNRRALEPILREFSLREGVMINTKYNGCGILTGEMGIIANQDTTRGFPDIFMACDVYYLDVVQDWFQAGINVSDTDIVIAVPKHNPKQIASLADLAKPGVRVTVGQPQQCTIGVLTRHLLKSEGIHDEVMKNVVGEMPSSALLVPSIIAMSAEADAAADATLAYKTDCQAEADRLQIIPIDSPAAKAVQPYSISKTSQHKQTARRLYEAIANSRDRFEAAGFNWRLDHTAPPKQVTSFQSKETAED